MHIIKSTNDEIVLNVMGKKVTLRQYSNKGLLVMVDGDDPSVVRRLLVEFLGPDVLVKGYGDVKMIRR